MSASSVPSFKRCSKCKEHKPATNEFFHNNRQSKDGLYHRCKICHCHKKPKEVLPEGTKRCTKCKEILPMTREFFFADARTKKDGLYGRCKACFLVDAKTSRDKDIEHTRVMGLASYYRNHDRFLAYGKRYREENHQAWRAKNKRWADANPLKVKAKTKRHNGLKRKAEGFHTSDDLERIYFEQEGRCAYCGITVFWDIPFDVAVDHIIPLSRGGTNWPNNIALACRFCNCSKGDKLLSEWERYGKQ